MNALVIFGSQQQMDFGDLFPYLGEGPNEDILPLGWCQASYRADDGRRNRDTPCLPQRPMCGHSMGFERRSHLLVQHEDGAGAAPAASAQ
jgi:hypothetical protein